MKKNVPLNVPTYQAEHHPEKEEEMIADAVGVGLQAFFLMTAGSILLAVLTAEGSISPIIEDFSINFCALMLEAMPFMLIGTLTGGLIEVFLPAKLIERFFQKGPTSSLFIAGGMGLVMPVCECAIVPIVRRLIIKGVPVPAAITFMLAGPIVNIIVGWSTAVAYTFNWYVVFLRLGCGYVAAVAIGLLFTYLLPLKNHLVADILHNSPRTCSCCHPETTVSSWPAKIHHTFRHASEDFLHVGKYLVIGAFIAAWMRTVVSISSFNVLGDAPFAAILLMMGLAVVLNLCSEADAFISASFRWLLPGSAQMGFMVLGPMLDLKLMMMYLTVFRKKTILLLSLTVFLVVFGLMVLLELTLPPFV
ncbi:MAG: permease [Desulfopila sp.]